MMKIPNYIKDSFTYIALSDEISINHSHIKKKGDKYIVSSTDELYIYLDNYSKKVLNFEISLATESKIYLISYNSRSTHLEVNFDLKANSRLKLYSNFISRRNTDIKIDRKYELADKASLVLLNNLSYNGQLHLTEEFYLNGRLANLDLNVLNVNNANNNTRVKQYVYHKYKETQSQISNWLISNDSSKLDYYVNGTIEKGNELSNCNQSNKGIILSPTGQIKVEPTLFIDEYNVKASHGAAIGQVDEEQLFYLLSRGLSELEAKSLIISGYINPFVNAIGNKTLENQLKRRIRALI